MQMHHSQVEAVSLPFSRISQEGDRHRQVVVILKMRYNFTREVKLTVKTLVKSMYEAKGELTY